MTTTTSSASAEIPAAYAAHRVTSDLAAYVERRGREAQFPQHWEIDDDYPRREWVEIDGTADLDIDVLVRSRSLPLADEGGDPYSWRLTVGEGRAESRYEVTANVIEFSGRRVADGLWRVVARYTLVAEYDS